jgi:hypothetical protein
MSGDLAPSAGSLKVVRCVDKRIATGDPDAIIAFESAAQVRFQQITGTGGTGNLQFTITPGSTSAGVGRMIYLTMSGTSKIQCGVVNVAEFNAANVQIGFRNNPLQSCITSAQVTINSSTFTMTELNVINKALAFYNSNAINQCGVQSTTNPTLDQYAGDYFANSATLSNPIRSGFDTISGGFVPPPRTSGINSIEYTAADANTGGYATVSWTLTEPLYISPLVVSGSDTKSIFGVNQMVMKLTMMPNLENMFSILLNTTVLTPAANTDGNITLTSMDTTFGSGSFIEATYYIPSEDSLKIRPIGLQRYSYTNFQHYTANVASVLKSYDATAHTYLAAGQTAPYGTSFGLPAIVFSSVPTALMIWATPNQPANSKSIYAARQTDSFLPISSLRMTIGQNSSVLVNASQRALWEFSLRAGLVCSYPRFCGLPCWTYPLTQPDPKLFFGGAPVIIRLQDCSLPDNICPSASVQTLIQINGTCYAPGSANVANATVHCLVLQSGILETQLGQSNHDLIALSIPEIAASRDDKNISEQELSFSSNNKGFSGAGVHATGSGSFWDDLYSGVKTVASQALPIAMKVLGAGPTGGQQVGGRRGGEYLNQGGDMQGGARMSRRSVLERLNGLH